MIESALADPVILWAGLKAMLFCISTRFHSF